MALDNRTCFHDFLWSHWWLFGQTCLNLDSWAEPVSLLVAGFSWTLWGCWESQHNSRPRLSHVSAGTPGGSQRALKIKTMLLLCHASTISCFLSLPLAGVLFSPSKLQGPWKNWHCFLVGGPATTWQGGMEYETTWLSEAIVQFALFSKGLHPLQEKATYKICCTPTVFCKLLQKLMWRFNQSPLWGIEV